MDEKDAAITEKVLRTWRVVEVFYVQIVMGGGGGWSGELDKLRFAPLSLAHGRNWNFQVRSSSKSINPRHSYPT